MPRLVLIFLVLILVWASPDPAAGKAEFISLCYHDVVMEEAPLGPPDAMPVTLAVLTDHFDWFRDNGYNIIGIDDILSAENGGEPLPPKSVLLSFDDGYQSFYHTVLPLLKAYNYKAMLALETAWLETPAGQPVDYGGSATLPRSIFLNWEQIGEISRSGLVEIASHSHDLHRGHLSSPFGIQQPSGSSLAWLDKAGRYESENEFYRRIKSDVGRSAEIIKRHTGRRPRVLVWPYGRYSKTGVKAALEAGYKLTAALGSNDYFPTFPRFLVFNGMNLAEVMAEVEAGLVMGDTRHQKVNFEARLPSPFSPRYPLQRVMHVDIDTVYDPNPEQQHKNISALFDRIEALAISTVYLQAYADPDGNGTADALYFPNRHLPMRADLFNYLAWQMLNRLNVEVYAWMPVLGFEISGRPLVEAVSPDKAGSVYARLSPFDEENKQIIMDIYRDLASHSIISGVIYHDDGVLGDYEDAGPAGRVWLKSLGLPEDIGAIHRDPALMEKFTRAKSLALINFTNELTAALESWSPRLKTARNMYAPVVMTPESEAWFAQNLDDFLRNYDYTGLMAMPYMEGAKNPGKWLRALAGKVREHPLGARKTVFELQAVDWRKTIPVKSSVLAEQMRLLALAGIGNFGYYPENPIDGHPDINTIYPAFSLRDNPFLKRK